MQLNARPHLRLVKPSPPPAPRPGRAAVHAHYQRMQVYARRIRGTEDADLIVRILEEAAAETAALRTDERVLLARGEVARATQRIEGLRAELDALRRLVHVDPLTGALNRAGLDALYQREAAHADRLGRPLSMALLDIDDFKSLNDAHGHPAGDAALVHFAALLRRTLRAADAVVRYGGEEFLVLMPHTTLAEAACALRRMRTVLGREVLVHGHRPLRYTFSAGVTERHEREGREAVIARADGGLYAAKRGGKHVIVACP
jgi:diguanylate cyclase